MLQNVNLSEIYPLIFIYQVFSPAKVIFVGLCVLLSVCTILNAIVRSIEQFSDS
jgi:hypothetical protein